VERSERFELLTFWFVASYSQNPNGLFGVAYEPQNALSFAKIQSACDFNSIRRCRRQAKCDNTFA
jgi:hypothetical protein